MSRPVRRWSLCLLAGGSLIALGCSHARMPSHLQNAALAGGANETLPAAAWTGAPPEGVGEPMVCGPECGHLGDAPPIPMTPTGNWRPDGIGCPWPTDEYLHDGGDATPDVSVGDDWHIHGLNPGDAIAHYDTLDGRRVIEPTCRVKLYAPRFGAVRRVVSVVADEQVLQPIGVERPREPVPINEAVGANTTLQNVQPVGQRGKESPGAYEMRIAGAELSKRLLPQAFQDVFQPFENLQLIRHGVFQRSEEARLAAMVDRAITWTRDQGVQVILEGTPASEVVGDRRAQATFTVDPIPGAPMLRVCKVADTDRAQPGDIVAFTIRFDNVGTETIGNVTIVDNLVTRMELVPDTAQSSLEADFFTQENEAGSLVLRWEIRDPLPVGEGGLVRFQCRVR